MRTTIGTTRPALAALLLLVAPLAACGDESAGSDTPGSEVVEGHVSDAVDGTPATVVVPSGLLEVVVGDPLDGEVPADLAADGEDHDAPDDGVFVPVSWSFDAIADLPGKAIVGQHPQELAVTMVAGDAQVDLPAPYVVQGEGIADSPVGTFYVPVGDASDLRLEATYDGLTQTLDVATGEVDAGAAEPLYATDHEQQPLDCPTQQVRAGGIAAEVTCEATLERVPYLPGTGWAPDDRSFAAVGYRVEPGPLQGDAASVTAATGTLTVDGQQALGPVETLGEPASGPGVASDLLVFDAAASGGTAELQVDLEVPRAGGTVTLTYRAELELP